MNRLISSLLKRKSLDDSKNNRSLGLYSRPGLCHSELCELK